MLSSLFGSEARVKVLSLFLLHAGSEFYLREIAQRTGLALRSVQRAAHDLCEIDILHRERRGNSLYFRLNGQNPIVPDLKAIFVKTEGLGDLLREALERDARIEVAFVYGSMAKGDETAASDVDLALIGEIGSRRLEQLLDELERSVGREVNATLFTRREWNERVSKGDHFVTTLLREPKVMLIGRAEDLTTTQSTPNG